MVKYQILSCREPLKLAALKIFSLQIQKQHFDCYSTIQGFAFKQLNIQDEVESSKLDSKITIL